MATADCPRPHRRRRTPAPAPPSSSSTPRASPTAGCSSAVKYPGENLSPEEAIERARGRGPRDELERVRLPAGQLPGAGRRCACCGSAPTSRCRPSTCLDAPHFRPREIVKKFWLGVVVLQGEAGHVQRPRRSTCRCWSWPRSATAIAARDYYQNSRNRFNGPHRPVDWMTNFGGVPAGRRAGPAGEAARQAGEDGGDRRPGVPDVPRRASCRRSTTTACATRWTRTSCSCAPAS